MKKRKKNNKPIIILIIGLLISGCLIFYSVDKIKDYRNFLVEHKESFEKKKLEEKEKCEADILAVEKTIETIENEIESLEKEITSLQRQKTDEFLNSRGFSDRYYELEDQISAKRKEISNKEDDIFNNNKKITELNSTIWEIESDYGDYRYQRPRLEKINPYVILAFGILGMIITFFASGISLLIKKTISEKSYSEYDEIDEGVLSEIDVKDGKLLKKELFGKLEKLLLASAKSDYDTIRKLCTKNMAKSYTDELDLLKKHNQKLIIKDLENIDSKIVGVRKNQHNVMITIVQKIKLYDYAKDNKNVVVSGNDKKRQTQAFKLVFVKDYVKNHSVKKCYNCGAHIKDATKVACDYCGTVFDNNNYDWYLESKVIISEN